MFGFFDSKQDKINKSITNLINTREVLLKRLPSLYQFKEFPLSTRDLMFFSNEQRAAYNNILEIDRKITRLASSTYNFPRQAKFEQTDCTPELIEKVKEYLDDKKSLSSGKVQFSLREKSIYDDLLNSFNAWKRQLRTYYKSFSSLLLRLIEEEKVDHVTFYKRAGLDRKIFSKIVNDPSYHPSRSTVLLCCIGLQLNIQEAEMLLESAGYSLSLSDDFDLVIRYCLSNDIYDPMDIDELLYTVTGKTLVSKY